MAALLCGAAAVEVGVERLVLVDGVVEAREVHVDGGGAEGRALHRAPRPRRPACLLGRGPQLLEVVDVLVPEVMEDALD